MDPIDLRFVFALGAAALTGAAFGALAGVLAALAAGPRRLARVARDEVGALRAQWGEVLARVDKIGDDVRVQTATEHVEACNHRHDATALEIAAVRRECLALGEEIESSLKRANSRLSAARRAEVRAGQNLGDDQDEEQPQPPSSAAPEPARDPNGESPEPLANVAAWRAAGW